MGLRPSVYDLSTIASFVCSACWQRVEISGTKSLKCSWRIKILENLKNFATDRVLPNILQLKSESYYSKEPSCFSFDTFPTWGKFLWKFPHRFSGRDFFQSDVKQIRTPSENHHCFVHTLEQKLVFPFVGVHSISLMRLRETLVSKDSILHSVHESHKISCDVFAIINEHWMSWDTKTSDLRSLSVCNVLSFCTVETGHSLRSGLRKRRFWVAF